MIFTDGSVMVKEYYAPLVPDPTPQMLWTLLSVLTVPMEEQLRLIGAETVLFDEEGNGYSGIYFYQCALSRYRHSWVDEFDFMLNDEVHPTWQEQLEQSYSVLRSLGRPIEYFKSSSEWQVFRAFVPKLLERVGLPPDPPAVPLDYDDYMRVMINADGFFVGLD